MIVPTKELVRLVLFCEFREGVNASKAAKFIRSNYGEVIFLFQIGNLSLKNEPPKSTKMESFFVNKNSIILHRDNFTSVASISWNDILASHGGYSNT